jgi:hypothetical protein
MVGGKIGLYSIYNTNPTTRFDLPRVLRHGVYLLHQQVVLLLRLSMDYNTFVKT